jgi:cell division protein FtsN
MARDYKSRANSSRSARKGVPGWVWFLIGLLVGLFFSGLAWLNLLPAEQPKPGAPVANLERRAAAPEPEPESDEAPPKPRFDFYTILPEMEVVVPEPEVRLRPTAAQKRAADQSKSERDRYMLQMGSFRKHADADRLKASLALVGIQAEIQRVNIDGGQVFHRVRSGPYTIDKGRQLRSRLTENGINSLMIKLK